MTAASDALRQVAAHLDGIAEANENVATHVGAFADGSRYERLARERVAKLVRREAARLRRVADGAGP